MARHPNYALDYAKYIIKGKWKTGEIVISMYPYLAYHYAKDVINSRFLLGENVIKNSYYQKNYEKLFNCKL
jgi:hypothetical protein